MSFLNSKKQKDDQAKLAALSKSQAIIEFAPDGTILDANENFLSLLGYNLQEIAGKHHKIFIDPEESRSSAYQDFWNSLRAGTFQAAEYKRIGKGGKEVWI